MNETEEKLRGPDGALTAMSLFDRLDAISRKLGEVKRGGVTPSEFARTEVIEKGLSAAREIVDIASRRGALHQGD